VLDGEGVESKVSKLGKRSSNEGSFPGSCFDADVDEGMGRGDDGFEDDGANESPNSEENELVHEEGELAPAATFADVDAFVGVHFDADFAEVAVETGWTGSRRSEKPSKAAAGDEGWGDFEIGAGALREEEGDGRKRGVAEDAEKEGLGWKLRVGL